MRTKSYKIKNYIIWPNGPNLAIWPIRLLFNCIHEESKREAAEVNWFAKEKKRRGQRLQNRKLRIEEELDWKEKDTHTPETQPQELNCKRGIQLKANTHTHARRRTLQIELREKEIHTAATLTMGGRKSLMVASIFMAVRG